MTAVINHPFFRFINHTATNKLYKPYLKSEINQMLKIILQEKIRSYFKIIRIILFLILTTILASIIVKNISTINLILILEHKYISLTIILLAIILILLKSYQLQKITSAFSQDKPYFHFIKT